MAKRLVTVGDLVVDIVVDARLPLRAAAHQRAKRLHFEAGGACTTILAARNMGLQVAALGSVGEDLQGRLLLETLAEAAVDTSALQIPAGGTTTTVLALTDAERSEHVFLGCYGEGAAITFCEAERKLLSRADAVFIPGYTLAEERLAGLVAGALDFVARHDSRLYLDAGPYLGQLSKGRVDEVLRLTDTLLLTEDEIPHVTAGEEGPAALLGLLWRCPALTIVLKLAARGCRVVSREFDLACPGFAVAVVDTVGAGDAFAAAWIWAELNGYSPLECGTIANAMGAASVGKIGAGGNAPSRAEAQALLDQRGTGINLSC